MKEIKFKTNINCGGCIDKVSPTLNQITGISHWEVDTLNKNKILTIHSSANVKTIVMEKIKDLGFYIETL